MNILITGASIAGPAAAFWLRRDGHTVTVVERAGALRTEGYAVDIRGVAVDVVERMGLREALRPFETDTESHSVVDARGRRFGRMPRGFAVIDARDVEILRGDLSRVLYEATRNDATYRFGDSIAELHQEGDGVDVLFVSGARERYDLVVGADGVHSPTRTLAFAEGGRCERALGSAMAIFTTPNFLGLNREQLQFQSVKRIASVKSSEHNRELKVAVFFPFSGAFDERDVEAQRRLVAAAFADVGWEFPRFIEAMGRADDFYCDVTCLVVMERFHTGRVVLVGDAGYCPSPLSGQGTSLALVGAYVLADALTTAGGDPRRALPAYDAAMRPFVERNQAIAKNLADSFAPQSRAQLWSHNLVMRLYPYLPFKSAMMKMAMRDVRDAARAITLPAPFR